MLVRLIALSLISLVAACNTPADLKAGGVHGTFATPYSMPVAKVAHCLQTGFENMSSDFNTRLTAVDADHHELLVRQEELYGALALVDIRPGRLEYWMYEGFLVNPNSTLQALTSRCP